MGFAGEYLEKGSLEGRGCLEFKNRLVSDLTRRSCQSERDIIVLLKAQTSGVSKTLFPIHILM